MSNRCVTVIMGRTVKVKLRRVELLMTFHFRTTGHHLPLGVTQCYLPPDTSEHIPP